MWNELSMKEKAQLIQLCVEQGITDLNTISDIYNQYASNEGFVDRPEVTVTLPNQKSKGGALNKFDGGGFTTVPFLGTMGNPDNERLISTGNEVADAVFSYMPIVGTAMDIEDAIRNPSAINIGQAVLSGAADLVTLGIGRPLLKGVGKLVGRGLQLFDTNANTLQQEHKIQNSKKNKK